VSKQYCGGNRRCNVIVEHIADPPKALHLTAIPLRPIAAGEVGRYSLFRKSTKEDFSNFL